MPEKNSFSQRSPIELSGDVLEINDGRVHVSRLVLSNLNPLSKARPGHAFFVPCGTYLEYFYGLQNLSYYKKLDEGEKHTLQTENFDYAAVI